MLQRIFRLFWIQIDDDSLIRATVLQLKGKDKREKTASNDLLLGAMSIKRSLYLVTVKNPKFVTRHLFLTPKHKPCNRDDKQSVLFSPLQYKSYLI